MSATDSPDRPAFHSIDHALIEGPAPLSRLAIVSLLLGILSLLALLSNLFIPICVAAAILGAASMVRIVLDSGIRGARLAQLGLGLGILSCTWSVTAESGRRHYLTGLAGTYAAEFLDLLSAGRKYEALELKRLEPERQITGTNLEEYYLNLPAEEREIANEFLNDPVTYAVLNNGAKWTLLQGLEIRQQGRVTFVTVDMKNELPDPDPAVVRVTLERHEGVLIVDQAEPTRHWNVGQVQIPH